MRMLIPCLLEGYVDGEIRELSEGWMYVRMLTTHMTFPYF